ncbi:DUF397 domain-containing protein [Kitasatospora aureofaciens]|uniref:DUF397 domain-containing protein n=1 Tax=Kitasatospora aureofaciens TaxID=1894 RepID=A0A1E7NE22_KITAU|nr:DUF397 domain-containing protein [Kitasatospora aureofaciens]ARF81303.1 DUF397 domain-containing protein [Kitasatospora aureofaciens]OEV38895.1 DUF397 domain-containing protein [Kitasatospora aureofaciens]GGU54282.1 hypothetical protein GCM10010502_00390 [Kitasatospora aureofaciens]
MINPGRDSLKHATWRKSRFSGNQGNCVEVADGFTGIVPVRDSKDPNGPALAFPAEAWTAFVAAIKTGELPNT